MEFSKVADSCFTWTINDFEKSIIDSLKKNCLRSSNFTTSIEPSRQWCLILSMTEKFGDHCDRCKSIRSKRYPPEPCNAKLDRRIINLLLVSNKVIENQADIKVNVSILVNLEKIYTRSFITCEDITNFGFDNFIDFDELMKIINDNQLEIFVEMFLKTEEKKNELKIFTNSEFLSDIQILIQEQKFYAHKVMLAAKSSYFNDLFKKHKEIKEINGLENIKPDAFNEILNYIYSDNIENWSLSCDILLGANFLKMDNLKSECEEYLRNNITMECVSPVLMLAVACDTKFLLKHCLYYILKNVNKLANSDNFQCLKTEPLIILNILKQLFEHTANGDLSIIDNISVSFKNTASEIDCQLLQDYEPFLNSEILSDITIQVGEKTYQCHKLILAAKSPVLRRMLMSNMKEAIDNFVQIKDMKVEVFHEVLRYMYTGKVENLQEHAIDILKAADQYNLDHLKKLCQEFLVIGLLHDNVVNIVKIANTYNASFLRKACIYFIVKEMIYYSRKKKVPNIIDLDSLAEDHSNILFEIFDALTKNCYIDYK